MTANTAAIFYNPSNNFLGTNLQHKHRLLKNSSSFARRFSNSRTLFLGGFVGDKLCAANAMDDGFKGACAHRDEKSDGQVQVVEQEAFIDGSSEFHPKFLFHELESTLNQMSKWLVTAIFGVFILWRHDAEALWFAAGSFLNAMLSASLKQMLNQKRPSTLKSDPGMPSSHAQSIFFIVLFIILSGMNEFTITSSGLALAFASYFSYLRVSQKLHTVSQVIVGAVTGSICAILWQWLWNSFMLDVFVSSSWVRIIVVLGSVGFCLGFLLHVIQHWLKRE
ncbi:lipid phosphate phosphatase epsilon 1, chloroplastic isoform X1 [Lotus japonicus]|uniref:Phosphatidic acid phosphatase type 2/haloperoxidase domain-containing protein n=1 Tax=Lotus japonicus TaxID=34305 RepID=I3S350_LOTJA|nr:lipid phosphate phosphatase epsilon 1, chloroplastic isoform X1 [Lotus japonicus]AFK34692.1 unknown [Lotus japonicus]